MDKDIYILGVGHNTIVTVDLVEACGFHVAGLYHYLEDRIGEDYFGHQIIGSHDELFSQNLRGKRFAISVGNNDMRAKLFYKISQCGGEAVTLIHPTAVVSKYSTIEKGVHIYANSIIDPDTTIGEDTVVSSKSSVLHGCNIGKHVFLAPDVVLGANTVVEDYAFIGLNATIISNKANLIGKHAVVGASAVVTKPVGEKRLVAGVPAKELHTEHGKKPLVSIDCITYNHAPHIRQCLDGFLKQKTDFLIEILIHDDASTDGTANIIREYEQKYPDLIKPIYQTENQWSKGKNISAKFNYPRAKGKYIAICEGDDYWTDPLKLKKQVDFLESHPDYGLIHTYTKVFYDNKGQFSENLMGEDFDSIDQLLLGNKIATLTTCFRADLYRDYIQADLFNPDWKMGDYPIWLYIAARSKVHFMNEPTAVYRILDNSASHSTDLKKDIAFILSAYDISAFFMHKYKKAYLQKKLKKNVLISVFISYLRHDMPVDYYYYSIVKSVGTFTVKLVPLIILSSFKFGRSFFRKRWNLDI